MSRKIKRGRNNQFIPIIGIIVAILIVFLSLVGQGSNFDTRSRAQDVGPYNQTHPSPSPHISTTPVATTTRIPTPSTPLGIVTAATGVPAPSPTTVYSRDLTCPAGYVIDHCDGVGENQTCTCRSTSRTSTQPTIRAGFAAPTPIPTGPSYLQGLISPFASVFTSFTSFLSLINPFDNLPSISPTPTPRPLGGVLPRPQQQGAICDGTTQICTNEKGSCQFHWNGTGWEPQECTPEGRCSLSNGLCGPSLLQPTLLPEIIPIAQTLPSATPRAIPTTQEPRFDDQPKKCDETVGFFAACPIDKVANGYIHQSTGPLFFQGSYKKCCQFPNTMRTEADAYCRAGVSGWGVNIRGGNNWYCAENGCATDASNTTVDEYVDHYFNVRPVIADGCSTIRGINTRTTGECCVPRAGNY